MMKNFEKYFIFQGNSKFYLFFKDIYSNMDKLPEKFIENEMMVDRISQILINDLYKLITIKGNNKTYYITVVYDPSRISLGLSSKLGVEGETVKTIVKNMIYLINLA